MNRALAVAEAVRARIASAGTDAGDRVYLGRLRPMTEDRRPLPDPTTPRSWINVVLMGVDTPGDDGQTVLSHIDWLANIGVDVYVRAQEAAWMTATTTAWAQVHAAIMADYTLGLPYVVTTDPLGASDPETDVGDLVSISMRTSWRVHFRTSLRDLEA